MNQHSSLDPRLPAVSRRSFLAAAVGATIGWPRWADAQCADDASVAQIVRSLDAAFLQDMRADNIPSVSYAVMGCQGVRAAKALGVLRAGGTTPATPTTLFQAASISKTIAAVTALRLVQAGKLTLDDPIDPLLKSWKIPPGPQSPTAPVTLRRLLSMTAGINVHGFEGYGPGEPQPTPVQILQGTRPANSPPLRVMSKPGRQEAYSGGGYQIAEMLMRDATGQDYADLASALVLEPLRMTNSHFGHPLSTALSASAADGHDNLGVPLGGRWRNYPELAAAGLWTTPTDLGLLCNGLSQAWLTNTGFLRQELAKEMMTPVDRFGYGLGGGVSITGGTIAFSKGGSNAGYKCNLILLPQSGHSLTIMTNADQGAKVFGRAMQTVAAGLHWPRFSSAGG